MPIQPAPANVVQAPATTLQRTIGPPELLWPASWWGDPLPSEDLPTFPEQYNRPERNNPKYNVGSVSFRSALRTATALWILDNDFDAEYGFKPLYENLKGSLLLEVKIHTGMVAEAQKIEAWKIKIDDRLSRRYNLNDALVEVKYTPGNAARSRGEVEPHDRFAIIDKQELWHFGHTVGGSQRSISAFSRGWPATTTGAVQYFEDLWGYL